MSKPGDQKAKQLAADIEIQRKELESIETLRKIQKINLMKITHEKLYQEKVNEEQLRQMPQVLAVDTSASATHKPPSPSFKDGKVRPRSGSRVEYANPFPINSEAFAFLSRCVGSKYDLTISGPLIKKGEDNDNPPMPQIPQHIYQLVTGGKLEDKAEEASGSSSGDGGVINDVVNYFKLNDINCEQKDVSLTPGILSAISNVLAHLKIKSPPNKVLLLTPTFGYYTSMLVALGIEFETFECKKENGYLPNLDELRARVAGDDNIPVMFMCYPNNPTGAVMTEQCARGIVEIASDCGATIISDEAFANNSLTERKHHSVASVPARKRVPSTEYPEGEEVQSGIDCSFVVTNPGKSIPTGEKLGYCVGREDLVGIFRHIGGYSIHSQRIVSAVLRDIVMERQAQQSSATGQSSGYAVEKFSDQDEYEYAPGKSAVIERDEEYFDRCRRYYLHNQETVKGRVTELNEIFSAMWGEGEYVKPLVPNPDASNVYLLSFTGLKGRIYNGKEMKSGLEVAEFLLDECGVGTVPGECSFIDSDEMSVRITLNHKTSFLNEVFNEIAISTIQSLKNGKICNKKVESAKDGQGRFQDDLEDFSGTLDSLASKYLPPPPGAVLTPLGVFRRLVDKRVVKSGGRGGQDGGRGSPRSNDHNKKEDKS